MTTTMKFSGKCSPDQEDTADVLVFGSVEFPNMPLYSNRISTSRVEGVQVKRHDCTLTGFVRGANHYEVRTQLAVIRTFSFYNHLHFLYYASDIAVVNAQVYIDNVSEPSDWKEYNAKYSISFHYFTCPCEDDPIGSPVTATTEDGEVYTFAPQPIFSITSANVRNGPYACYNSLYDDQPLGQKIIMNYTGVLCSDTHVGLVAEMDALNKVIKDHFVLKYGNWNQWVFVEKTPSYAMSDFTTHATYQFTVSYYDSEIYELESKISFTRQHHYPKVTPRLYCAKTEVDTFHLSGQYITYSLKLLAVDRVKTRILLNQEYAKMIVGADDTGAAGTHMEGGNEEWNPDGSMSVTSRWYYKKPILELVEISGEIPDELEQYKCEKTDPEPEPVPP